MYTGLALNNEDDLMLVDTGSQTWPPSLITYAQDGRLVHSAPFLPLKGCVNASKPRSKLRFMECVGDSTFVVDLGTFANPGVFMLVCEAFC